MAYYVNKTDGTAIVILDGTKDTTSTSLTLFGRLVQNYGDEINENFVHLLENFALDGPGGSPPNPIVGQLWFDTAVNNIKVYTTDNEWVVVGSKITGNVDLTGNLIVGPNNFQVYDSNGNVVVVNSVNQGNISFISNVGGVATNVLHLSGHSGLIEVNANAVSSFGVTTKVYVDSEINSKVANAITPISANISSIDANLATRVAAEQTLSNRIDGANVQIALRDTIVRVNNINKAIDDALQANIVSSNSIVNANLVARIAQTIAVETAMLANIAIVNANVQVVQNGVNSANVEIALLKSNVNTISTDLSSYALKESPTFTGTPTAPTPALGNDSTRIATTAFVQTAINSTESLWQGSRKFVSTADPTSADGNNGDIWFKYSV